MNASTKGLRVLGAEHDCVPQFMEPGIKLVFFSCTVTGCNRNWTLEQDDHGDEVWRPVGS